MINEKICLINESKYSLYHNPGNTASKILIKNLDNVTIIEKIPENLGLYLNNNNFKTVIFLNVPTIRPTIYEISKIQKKIKVGIFFDDSAQYFNNWFRYLTQVIDFALCWEPVDVSLFETYGVPATHLPGLFVTYLDQILDHNNVNWSDRKIGCLHIGRMDRPGRKSLESIVENKFDNCEFWGEGTKNGYIQKDSYVQKLFASKIALNNSGCAKYNFVKKSDPIEWSRRQYKGKIFHYFLAKCVVLTQDSPQLEKYFKDGEDLLIYKDEKDLISKINLLLNNSDLSKNISNSGYNKALSYVNEELNIKKFKEVLERADIKKINRPVLKLYIDKYYSRSIAAFDGDEIISSFRNIKIFIKTIKFLILDIVILKILLRKILKKIIRG